MARGAGYPFFACLLALIPKIAMTAIKAPKKTAHAIPRMAISSDPRESSCESEFEEVFVEVSGLRVCPPALTSLSL